MGQPNKSYKSGNFNSKSKGYFRLILWEILILRTPYALRFHQLQV